MIETHIVAALATFLFFNLFQGFELNLKMFLFSVFGGIISDIDSETSVIGRSVRLVVLCRKLGISIQHRGFFHSVSFLILCGILLTPLIWIGFVDCYVAFLISLLTHQVIDSLSPDGLRWGYPSDATWRFSPNPKLTVANGSPKEASLRLFLIVAVIVLLPINYIGLRWVFNWGMADVEAAIQWSFRWGNKYELWARFEAKHCITKQLVKDRWRIIGESGKMLILQNRDGQLVTISDSYGANSTFKAKKIRVYRGSRIKMTQPLRISMTGRSIDELASFVEKSKPHRLFGNIILEQPYPAKQDPFLFSPIRSSARNLVLDYATLSDLDRVKNRLVEKGEVTVVYSIAPDDSIVVPEQGPDWIADEFEIDTPSELSVSQGSFIQQGGILAKIKRYARSLDEKLNERESVRAKMRDAETTYLKEISYIESRQHELDARLEQAETELKDYRERLKQGWVTQKQVEDKKIRVQSLMTDIRNISSKRQNAITSHKQELTELRLKLERTDTDILELKQKAYIYSQCSGKIKRIVMKRAKSRFKVRIYIEQEEDHAQK